MSDLTVRQARADDYEAIAAFTSEIWANRGGDYIPHVYHDWIAADGETQRTFVVDAGDDVAGICQYVLLSEHEAWAQGMRVNPAFRGEGVSNRLNRVAFDWAAERGATVVRNMVYSWNAGGLGSSRGAGFESGIEFRWAHPDPDPDALDDLDSDATVPSDPDAAWSYWMRSDGRDVLGGLALDDEETWALSELTRDGLRRMADETAVFAVQDGGTRGMGYRVREYDRETGGEGSEDGEDAENEAGEPETERWAEYGVGVWADVEAARALFAAIAADAAAIGADRTRVLIPETPRHVSDAAYARAGISDEPKFVLEADLTDRR